MKQLLTILVMACCALASGCGGAPIVSSAPSVIGEWVPKIFDYLGKAESALSLLGAWANRFQGMPQVAEHLPELNAFLQDAQKSFDDARELAKKGSEFEQQASDLYAQGRESLDKAIALAQSLGMHREGKLVRPPEPEGRAACPRSDGPDELVLELPPNQV